MFRTKKYDVDVRPALIVALLMVVAPASHAQQAPGQAFDDYVSAAMKQWQVPGVAIAIVKDDRVVLAKGYGVRELGKPERVNENTLFAIGSSSKAFTAAALAMLVDEGKLTWDDPATRYLPGLQLYDPYTTRELTVTDLLSHRSGLPRADLLWYASAYDRNEILRRIRYLRPTSSLRARFGYQNIMYLAAGQIIPSLTGLSWDAFVSGRIFKPLGMTSTSTSITALVNATDVAAPHARLADNVQVVARRNVDNMAPAAAINSNAVDMAQWVRLQLGNGVYQNQRLISSVTVREMHSPQTIIELEDELEKLYPEAHFLSYGMGWFLSDYRGRKVVEHGGGIDGMKAEVAMIPAEGLGIVILTNLHGTNFTQALMFKVFDLFLGGPPRDWSSELLNATKGRAEEARAIEQRRQAERVKGTSPSLALNRYAGTYENELYGEARIAVERDKLVVRFGPNFTGDLEHWNYDAFRVTWRDPIQGHGLLNFRLSALGGRIGTMLIENIGEFTPVPDSSGAPITVVLSTAELRKFMGTYELASPRFLVTVELVGGRLTAIIPGQPRYPLVPLSSNRFRLEGDPDGFDAQFELADGLSPTLTLLQGSKTIAVLPRRR
jgi:CubicO group peptidase (beta-lactamase class C family)